MAPPPWPGTENGAPCSAAGGFLTAPTAAGGGHPGFYPSSCGRLEDSSQESEIKECFVCTFPLRLKLGRVVPIVTPGIEDLADGRAANGTE